jgi:hypothetical protein
MEPELRTEPRLLPILYELSAREPIFHRAELGTSRADFESMIDPAFWEVGASGSRYSREFVLAELEKRYSSGAPVEDLEAEGFHCLQLCEEVYLLTYTLRQGRRLTRRSTIWRRAHGEWKIVYHQGTVVVQQVP